MESLAERAPSCVLEAGPGVTLSAMWRARHPDIPARSLDEFRSAQAAADWTKAVLASKQ
jgi:[acyl-carrier-protein] S-malonyltransferase